MKLKNIRARDLFVAQYHPGLTLCAPLEWTWREHPRAEIFGLSLSQFAHQVEVGNRFMRKFNQIGKFSRAVEFNTTLAVADNLRVANEILWVNGKALVNARHGLRLRNRILRHKGKEAEAFDAEYIAYFGQVAQSEPMNRPLVAQKQDIAGLDLVLDCKQSYNYYHFMTEVMCNLCLALEMGVTGNIYIHSPSTGRAGFIDKYIQAFFPQLAGRVFFPTQTKKDYGRALVAIGLQQLYFMCGDQMMPSLDGLAPKNWRWQGRKAERRAYLLLAQNAFERSLRVMRQHFLSQIPSALTEGLPKRFYVTRNLAKTPRRPTVNEGLLIEALKQQGFAIICFEDLTPKEQIAHVSQADVIVMAHGAGMTNMLFAKPQATIIELSNFQSAINRFGNFNQHAHASGCRYLSILCDHGTQTPEQIPNIIRDGHAPLMLQPQTIAQLINLMSIMGLTGQE